MDLSRREFLPASASLAGVALAGGLPVLLTEKAAASIPWTENELTKKLEGLVQPPSAKVKAKKDVHALTADEWDTLANSHQALADEHSRLGNLHHLDLAVQAHQAELRKKFSSKYVDRLLQDGSHLALTKASTAFHDVAKNLRGSSPDIRPNCTDLYTFISVSYSITSFLLFDVPPLATLFFILSISADLAGIYMCG